jgi:pilus assembly protein FimV
MDSQADQFDAMLEQSPTDMVTDGSLSSQLAAEFPFLAEQDDQQVNLDLARSYADLGELQSARELLANVLVNGSSNQQDDARQLLAKIAS